MIVLDTNVPSEPLRPRPDAGVLRWLAALDEPVAITAVSVGELLVGVSRLARGRRRSDLHAAVTAMPASHASAVLPDDDRAAHRYAVLQEQRREHGRPLSVEDGMITTITATHDAVLATRNTRDFDAVGLRLVDPWRTPGA